MILVGCVALLGLFGFLGTPRGHSFGFNVSWFAQFEQQIWSGVIYPRHMPEMWFGLGGLDFFFYSPLPFWIIAILGRISCIWCETTTVFAIGGAWILLFSGFTFYFLAKRFFERSAALFATVIYLMLPYHLLLDWFVRQAVGEFTAYVFVPLLAFGFIEAVERSPRAWSFAIAFAGLILSHLPSALLSVHVFFLIFVIWAWTNRDWKNEIIPAFINLCKWGFLGLALASFYWIPCLVLIRDVSPDGLYGPDYVATNWLYFDGKPQVDSGLSVIIFACLVAAVVTTSAAVSTTSKTQRWLRVMVAVPVVLSFLLMTSISRPIWEHWVIAVVQFPWRLMLFVDMSSALAAGVIIEAVFKNNVRHSIIAVLAVGVLAIGLIAAAPRALRAAQKGYSAIEPQSLFIGASEYLPPHFFQFVRERLDEGQIPITRSQNIVQELALKALNDARDGRIVKRQHRNIIVELKSDRKEINIPIIYWKHYIATSDTSGKEILIEADQNNGTIIAFPDDNVNIIRIRLPLHWSELAGLIVSLFSGVLLLLQFWKLYGDRIRLTTPDSEGKSCGKLDSGPS